MYDASWYETLVPSSQEQRPRQQHTRRESLLKQPEASQLNRSDKSSRLFDRKAQEPVATNARPSDNISRVEPLTRKPRFSDPPKATVARRAKSYSAFYDAAVAVLKKDRKRSSNRRRSRDSFTRERGLNAGPTPKPSSNFTSGITVKYQILMHEATMKKVFTWSS